MPGRISPSTWEDAPKAPGATLARTAETQEGAMSPDTEDAVVEEGELVEPIGHVRVVYLGPVAPHWEVQSDYGPADVIEQFRERVLARLVLLPPHDPQFRRNSERVVRDAEREQLALEWVLDFDEEPQA
jgi:hypothetical protein